jgi:hypothetical protein
MCDKHKHWADKLCCWRHLQFIGYKMGHYATMGSGSKNWEYGETSIHLQPFAFVSLVDNHPEVPGRGVHISWLKRVTCFTKNWPTRTGGQEIGPLLVEYQCSSRCSQERVIVSNTSLRGGSIISLTQIVTSALKRHKIIFSTSDGNQ